MSALASTAVTMYPGNSSGWWYSGRDQTQITRRLKLVLTGQGGATNTIGAAALGFNAIISCSNLWDATNSKVYPAAVDPVNGVIILADGSAAPAPVDVTSTATYITVTGTPVLAR